MKPMQHTTLLTAAVALALAIPAQAEEPFSETKAIIEINASDGDAGFHALMDGGPWRWAKISDPMKRKLFVAKATGALRDQGLSENFFESAEPVCDPEDVEDDEPVVSLAEFIDRFPAGDYRFSGKTLDGENLRSTSTLTYDLPAAPDIEMTEDLAFAFDPDDPDTTPIWVMWEPGDDLGEKCHDQDLVDGGVITDPATVEIVGWEAVVEGAEADDLSPNRVVVVQLVPDQTAFQVSSDYLDSLWDDLAEDGALWVKFEVGAIEASGNQTFSEGEFCLYDSDEADCEVEEGED